MEEEKKEREVIAETDIKREKGFIYPTGTNKKTGCLTILKIKAGRHKKEEKKSEEVK